MTDIIEPAGDEPAELAPIRPSSPTFAELGARPETVAALAEVGIVHAFAIQEYALPIALRGTDLIGQAPTGTGKTLGFGVPLVDRVFAPAEGADGVPQALVVVPTRELGLQVAKDLAVAGKTRGVRVLPIYGGVAYETQIETLKSGVEILVGTPGRLMDLAKQKKLRLDRIRALVLDEADRMLDLGFLDDVERILAMLPEDRQTMLFSATMPDPIVALSRRFLRQPVTIHAGHAVVAGVPPLTRQVVYRTHPMNKIEIVARIMQAEERGLTMIFTRTKRAADRVAEDLDFRGFAVAAVHGDLGQGARERALRAFRAGKIDILVATDVAARGLDVSGVTHVINYDCPEDQDTYTHRIGRTGRAGASGVAVTFVDWEDITRWRIIDKTLGLEMPEPPETYHTSDHLYADLGISRDITGTLPSADRTRVGLSAEVEEDLGGRAPSSRRRDGGGGGRSDRGPRGGDSRSRSRAPRAGSGSGIRSSGPTASAPSTGTPSASTPTAAGEDTAAAGSRRPRRRRRAGQPVGDAATGTSAGTSGAPASQDSTAGHSAAGHSAAGHSGTGPATGTDSTATGPQSSTAATGVPAARRRRRRRSGSSHGDAGGHGDSGGDAGGGRDSGSTSGDD
ncbi:DEAD/DEAH box helicase [Micromonospora sp. NBC_01813]|uniref:DEAD/DEAH box helicase n=1 Tax=Micromonospora sp. NBC_01813 TaxID=2975988 RepID=UPI002DDC8C0A|nr:DEAD/DEAH box helicase [Micromonospora sp. NBC_01813]WSA08120.1 DEAD/DEAH box helicase [Micromonospora sp. NBC_01813]